MDDVNWEMMMIMTSAEAVSDAISPPVGAPEQQENSIININNINHDCYKLDDQVVELVDDQDRPSEEKNGTSSGVITVREGREGDNQGRMRRYSRNRNTRSVMKQPNLVSSQHRTPRVPIVAPPSPPPRVVNKLMVRFLFKKQLHNSDVSAAGRIVIPKKVAELHLPVLEAKEGTWLHFNDMDLFQVWPLKFRYWPNNSSRMYVFENTKDFVSAHGLAVDDHIMVYKDDETGSYVIRAKKSVVKPIIEIINTAAYNNITNTNPQNANVMINNPAVNIEYGGNNWPLNYSGDGLSNIDNNLYANPMDQFNGGISALAQPSAAGNGQGLLDQQLSTFGFDDFLPLFG